MSDDKQMTNRETAFELLGYSSNQTIAGMAACDLPKLNRIEASLDQAERRGWEKAIEAAAKECVHKREYCLDPHHDDRWCLNCSAMEEAAELCAQRIQALTRSDEKGTA